MSDIDRYIKFSEAAYITKQHDPWVIRREFGKEYASFIIVKCRNESWWYKDFIGIEFFGMINKDSLREDSVTVVRLTGTKIHTGRNIPIGDLIMI